MPPVSCATMSRRYSPRRRGTCLVCAILETRCSWSCSPAAAFCTPHIKIIGPRPQRRHTLLGRRFASDSGLLATRRRAARGVGRLQTSRVATAIHQTARGLQRRMMGALVVAADEAAIEAIRDALLGLGMQRTFDKTVGTPSTAGASCDILPIARSFSACNCLTCCSSSRTRLLSSSE